MTSKTILQRYTQRLKPIVDSPDFELKKIPHLPIIQEMFLREEGNPPTAAALARQEWWTLLHKGEPVAISFTLPIPGPAPHFNWFVPERLWQGYGTVAIVHTGRIFLKKPGAFIIGALIDNPIGLRQIGVAIRFLETDYKKPVRVRSIFDHKNWIFDFLVWTGREPK